MELFESLQLRFSSFKMWTVLCICVLLSDVAYSIDMYASKKRQYALDPKNHTGSKNNKNKGTAGVPNTQPFRTTTSPPQNPDPMFSVVVNGQPYRSLNPANQKLQHKQINYTEGDDITIICTSKIHQIFWEVPFIGLSSEKNQSKTGLILGKLDRYDDTLKIICKTSTQAAAVTFRWNNIERQMDTKTTHKLAISEGESRSTKIGETCGLLYPNKTKTSESFKNGSEIYIFGQHNNSLLFCAEFVNLRPGVTELRLNKTIIMVQEDKIELKGNIQKLTYNDAEIAKDDTSQLEDASALEAFIPIIGGAVAILVTMIALIILCTCYSRRKHETLDENIYSEPNHLEYAEIRFHGHGPIPMNKNEPYAKIVGVVKKKRNNKPSPLPHRIRRNQIENTNEENGYAEIHLKR